MSPSQICKVFGLKGMTDLARITGKSRSTLKDWANNNPDFFLIVVIGAADFARIQKLLEIIQSHKSG